MKQLSEKRYRRHKRIRAKIFGTSKRPRLCIFRSAKHIYAQLIDDEKNKILVSASDKELKIQSKVLKVKKLKTEKDGKPASAKATAGKSETAFSVGKLIAQKALENNIKEVVFDRAGYAYHGRVKALAEGAREGGLKF